MSEAFIEIKGLTKTFHTRDGDLEVLKGIDLSIQRGEIFGIIGFSGAGKSTLARCINRLETPDSGAIHIGGQDILALSDRQLRQRRRKLGLIFQTFNLWEAKTVYDNIAYPLKIAGEKKTLIREKVLATAELVGLTDKLNAYPGGLSGGQKQRVGIARAIVTEPDVLLSDEATSALDPQTTIQILDLLRQINQKTGITILMITHELDAIKYSCQRMAVLEDGVITEQGDVHEIFHNSQSRTGALFAKVFFEMQQAGEVKNGEGI